ncbi:MAG: amidohydrolase family protein [Gammaproteobacteria bacterium]|nr:amidohydrolase family protein [Gammaproteobacteria bacterium]
MPGPSAASSRTIVAGSYFCGRRHHDAGPYAFHLQQGRIVAITSPHETPPAAVAPPVATAVPDTAAFLLPGLVEAHCHLFLGGAARQAADRSAGQGADFAGLAAIAEANIRHARAHGITLIRDAGDRHGINHEMRRRRGDVAEFWPAIRSPGPAIRRAGGYGRFMAIDVATPDEAVAAVDRVAQSADDVKILLTGIVDFEHGAVPQGPQFDVRTLRQMIDCAHGQGRPVFAHCSGAEGIELAIAAGVDSIEHGYFMTAEALRAMAGEGIAWVPTVAPVHFQWKHPQYAGWPAATVANLGRIVGDHLDRIALADQLGVRLIAGSDAGSPGVGHGRGLLQELSLFGAAGLPMDRVLASATATPRQHWGQDWPVLVAGAPAEFCLLAQSPFDRPEVLLGDLVLVAGDPLATFGCATGGH